MAKRRFIRSAPGGPPARRQGLKRMRVIDSHTGGASRPGNRRGRSAARRWSACRAAPLASACQFDHSAASPSTSRTGTMRSWGLSSASRTIRSAQPASSISQCRHDRQCAGTGRSAFAVTLAHMGRLKPGPHRFENAGRRGRRRADHERTATGRQFESHRFAKRSMSRFRARRRARRHRPGAATGSS